MRNPVLTEYKKMVREIKSRKGTAAWLFEFVKLISNSGYFENFMRLYKLSPQEFVYLKTIAKKFDKGESCGFINQGLADFLTKQGFYVEPVEIGWIASGEAA